MKQVAQVCKLLGDLSRLRILRVLRRERLNVSELTGVLGLSQSGVSRHLKLLAGAGLVHEHREGSWTYYEAADAGAGPAGTLLGALEGEIETAPDHAGDLARLAQTLDDRRAASLAPFARNGGVPVPGRSWLAWSRALLRLLPRALVVADIGCGEAGPAIELARSTRQVYGVDRSPEVLARARRRVAAAGLSNLELRRGELEQIPLDDASVDLCLLSQALHHAASPAAAVAEAARILVPGGRLIVLDLEPHHEEWVRGELGDQWLGFTEERLRQLMAGAGLIDVDYERLPARAGDPFRINITSARTASPETAR